MTIQELKTGYQEEVTYQKHMLRNLGYWVQLCTVISGVGIVLTYFFHAKNLWLTILGIVLLVIGALGMLMFGYSGWKGQQNIKALINDYELKIDYLHQQMQKK